MCSTSDLVNYIEFTAWPLFGIIEYLNLEGTHQDHQVQPPAPCRATETKSYNWEPHPGAPWSLDRRGVVTLVLWGACCTDWLLSRWRVFSEYPMWTSPDAACLLLIHCGINFGNNWAEIVRSCWDMVSLNYGAGIETLLCGSCSLDFFSWLMDSGPQELGPDIPVWGLLCLLPCIL